MYSEDDMLMLSGIQHFRFCPRQWALIHIEQQWDDNRLTIEGQILHKHVDAPFYRQKCGDQITLRAVNIASRELGLLWHFRCHRVATFSIFGRYDLAS